ncbi:GDP-mannose 4,6-dehydratase [Trinickia caryophylli]|uniref:Nucleoside-diphosphate-sugar epimerase n=1 Tax=Trinickia caryophylli TaxID=28094 RepID=A0A1X7G2K3_TRICW|nr:GDP-mannose 4,6-dehydratase [Trinickia caryophylli]PMS13714.1 epimerase [Trinickia caryophylli]TRX14207.1 NAD-dependent epimerase/dehydratase family protein [Trinickia caryophylli]WQE14033.1 GDP-mannose 4,6-dehydratase [Trinickia caryophylli]SMF62914.1 Nucleoside-diphosphate-sugar epimerase [Trinickia caryophylli]GLU33479.1 UDP-glucose 4-epimerase [Trinickia caryophylli]
MTAGNGQRAPRALVTGAAGFTGRHLAATMSERGYDVWAAVSPGVAAPQIAAREVAPIDLLDPDGLHALASDARPDVVVHLAAASHVTQGTPTDTYVTNIVGTRNLLAALASLDERPRCVLLASSGNVYGNATLEVIDENVVPQPANDYAVSKFAMEHAARLWMDRLPICIARPFNYTGVGQREDFLLPKIVGHHARRAPRISLGNLHVSRDFSDVRDVVEVYARLVEAAPAGETFNICSGVSHSLMDVLRMLEDIAGYRIDVFVDPRFLRANEVHRLVGSNLKLRRAIGHAPNTPLRQTLEWMYTHAAQPSA